MNPVPRQITPILFLFVSPLQSNALQGPGGMEGIKNQVVPPGDPIHRLRALNNLHIPGPEKGGTSEPIASNASNPLSSDPSLASELTAANEPPPAIEPRRAR
ncbi:hypothetical protein Acr_00g0014480 [Actinidia rufa]|uniref:Uncharacterized protein n=1 Tax=Actinidia rufa TaxID=165716 RepID=A0A7J0DAG1_9ERIC|nr:hypothetical protein Acr_00g0014480 [Actinidia rufa]